MEPERIINGIPFINSSNYILENCQIYMTPEQVEAEAKVIKKEQLPIQSHKTMPSGKILESIQQMNIKSIRGSMIKRRGEISEKEKDNIREYIKDFMGQIFKSEINEKDLTSTIKTDYLNSINHPFGRQFFLSLLSKNVNLVHLQKASFDLLGMLIYNSLLQTLRIEQTNQVLEDIVQLIKSTKFFVSEDQNNKKKKRIFDFYKNKIQTNPIVEEEKFWQKWYDMEVDNIKNMKSKPGNKSKINNDVDDYDRQKVIYNICKSLIELEVPKSIVKTICKNITNKAFGEMSELNTETFDHFIKLITTANYISKPRI